MNIRKEIERLDAMNDVELGVEKARLERLLCVETGMSPAELLEMGQLHLDALTREIAGQYLKLNAVSNAANRSTS